MPRKSFIVVFTLFCFAFLLCTVAFNQEENKEDVQQIRDLLYRENEGHHKGDQEQIYSCYAPGFVGYSANGYDPEVWVIWIAGLEELRSKYAQNVKESSDKYAEHPDWARGTEVHHVNVYNDHAIALTFHWDWKPDPKTRENITNSHRTVWMLAKIRGEWKITSFIGQITTEQRIWKLGPE